MCVDLRNRHRGPISDRVSELHDASRLVIRGAEGEHDWPIFVVAGQPRPWWRTVAYASVEIRRPFVRREALRPCQTSLHCLGMSRAARSYHARGSRRSWRLSKHGNRSWARSMRSRPPLLQCGQAGDAQSCSSLPTDDSRWQLRRSTHIGGIATDHDATARAARSTPASLTVIKDAPNAVGGARRSSASILEPFNPARIAGGRH